MVRAISHHQCGLGSIQKAFREVRSTMKSFYLSGLGPVSRKSRELFGPEKPVVKLQSTCFENLIFYHVFKVRKFKRMAKFYGLESRRCEDIKRIVALEIDPKRFGTFEKQTPGNLKITNWS